MDTNLNAKRFALYVLIGLMMVPIQSFAFGTFHLTRPDLALLAVYFAGLFYGENEGLWLGFFLGIILDVAYGGIPGVNFASKLSIGYLSGIIGRNVIVTSWLFDIIAIFCLSLLDSLIIFILLHLFGHNMVFNDALRGIILPCAFFTSCAGFFVSCFLKGKMRKPGERYGT